ncbi:MAG TPA: glycosyltransferase family 2 protein [Bacteroidia bacterium]|nr:glycosyltransferase family 2 protein [Bacteroidia bacterium]
MSDGNSDVYIIIPTFNEGKRLEQVVKSIQQAGFSNIVVIDDGSTDDSVAAIAYLKPIILQHLVNRGAGAATETGLNYCRDIVKAETVVMIDADTQHDAADIIKLLEEHRKQQADITIGNRFLLENVEIPAKTVLFNQVANIVTGIFAGERVHDSQSGFKVFNHKALQSIIIEQDKYEHCSEILIKAHEHKLKVIDVPITVYYPEEIKGKGQHFLNGVKTFINLLHAALFKN